MDWIKFDDQITVRVVEENKPEWVGTFANAVGQRTRDLVCKMLTTPFESDPGTLGQINYIYLRLDGSTILGSAAQWRVCDTGGTTISTRYNDSTYVTQVNFISTYTATANITCKCGALTDSIMSGATPVGTAARFYSTSMNVSVGSAGKIIVSWDVSIP